MPKQNNKVFFCPKEQELEVGPHSGPYLLVTKRRRTYLEMPKMKTKCPFFAGVSALNFVYATLPNYQTPKLREAIMGSVRTRISGRKSIHVKAVTDNVRI